MAGFGWLLASPPQERRDWLRLRGRTGQKSFPRARLGRRPAVWGFYAWQYSGCPMKAGTLSESGRIRPHLTPLECGIIFGGIPAGAISRKGGLIWGIPDTGISALLTLLAIDAAGLDLAAIDVLRRGEALSAAYGPRKTRRDKNLGKQMQSWLKDLKSADEPATTEAADRYVEYRYLDHGNLPNYKKRKEFEGDTPSERYYREWFRDFNKALGFWQPGPGRPSNTPDHH